MKTMSAAVCTLVMMISLYLTPPVHGQNRAIGSRLEPFMDHFLIDKMDNTTLRLHRPTPANLVVVGPPAAPEAAHLGFGEEVLKVQTGDNVDNEENRRALYLLSNSKPAASAQFPRTNWKKVK